MWLNVLDQEGQSIVRALENPKWDWRTIDGIAEEIGISPQRVASILALLPNVVDIVQSAVPDKRGRLLFTTRNHYFKRQNIAKTTGSAACPL